MKSKWIGFFLVGLLILAAGGTQVQAAMGPGRVDLPLIAGKQY